MPIKAAPTNLRQSLAGKLVRHAHRTAYELGRRIEASLPLDLASDEAQAFIDEWFALLKPFTSIATREMWSGTIRMYDDMANWETSPGMGFGPVVWKFIKSATRARLHAGGTLDGPAWLMEAR